MCWRRSSGIGLPRSSSTVRPTKLVLILLFRISPGLPLFSNYSLFGSDVRPKAGAQGHLT
jgi:hypothetical protein